MRRSQRLAAFLEAQGEKIKAWEKGGGDTLWLLGWMVGGVIVVPLLNHVVKGPNAYAPEYLSWWIVVGSAAFFAFMSCLPLIAVFSMLLGWICVLGLHLFEQFWDLLQAIGRGISWLWSQTLEPLFRFLGRLLRWLGARLLGPFFRFLGRLLRWLGARLLGPFFVRLRGISPNKQGNSPQLPPFSSQPPPDTSPPSVPHQAPVDLFLTGGSLPSSPSEPTSKLLSAGRLLGQRFRLERLLGQGGMGQVWLAHDILKDRKYALKTILPALAIDPAFRSAFILEITLTESLHHPGIIRTFDLQADDAGHLFYTMEYIEGQTLEAAISSARSQGTIPLFPIPQVVSWLSSLADSLAYAHQKGVIHRDLKPSNILLAADGSLKLMDFGIAKVLSHTHATQHTGGKGSPYYMAPEQVRGASDLTPASDLYSLGVLAYELLTGDLPSGRWKTPKQRIPGFPDSFEKIILRALENDPADRFQDALSFKQALASVPVPPMPPPAPPTVSPPPVASPPPDAPPATTPPATPSRPTPFEEMGVFEKIGFVFRAGLFYLLMFAVGVSVPVLSFFLVAVIAEAYWGVRKAPDFVVLLNPLLSISLGVAATLFCQKPLERVFGLADMWWFG